ncbi:hypothetical protein NQ314_019310 [Rhamnusium bicolor]|uniref:Uncharacterized protein n=1 Tax=Rhamnusium bicolor TaxID=1586634 RepID=A0AAV8WNR4_9CUCU|nr:hypothetical protein NQ314_019310 [Rhamnusium bicolor]
MKSKASTRFLATTPSFMEHSPPPPMALWDLLFVPSDSPTSKKFLVVNSRSKQLLPQHGCQFYLVEFPNRVQGLASMTQKLCQIQY